MDAPDPTPNAWRPSPHRTIDLQRPRLLAVLNLTPDSFSDGGTLDSATAAAHHAQRSIHHGADALDIGGESTRPGAARIPPDEQLRRVLPAIRAIRQAGITVPITIDTTLAVVAEAALDAGADAINDVSAGDDSNDDTIRLAAARHAGIILMHRLTNPADDVYSHQHAAEPAYTASTPDPADRPPVVTAVRDALQSRARHALGLGVHPSALCLDPGLGFGKSVPQNLALMRRADEFAAAFGTNVLWGASRKSFIGATVGVEQPDRRDAGSVGAACAVLARGGRFFRVHAVKAHRHALDAAHAVHALETAAPRL